MAHGTTRSTGKSVAVLVALLLVCFLVSACSPHPSVPSKSLEELRLTYPETTAYPALAEMRAVPLSERVNWETAYILAETISTMTSRTVILKESQVDPIEWAQDMRDGIVPKTGFLDFEVKVLDIYFDKETCYGEPIREELRLTVGDEITVSCSDIYGELVPEMKPGDRFIMPIVTGNEHASTWDFKMSTDLYYVTADERVLSVSPIRQGSDYDGMKLQEFVRIVRKLEVEAGDFKGFGTTK